MGKPWSDEETNELTYLWPRPRLGSAAEIGERLGRSERAVRDKARALGLGNRDGSEEPVGPVYRGVDLGGMAFADDPRAARPEPMVRGRPETNTGCGASSAYTAVIG